SRRCGLCQGGQPWPQPAPCAAPAATPAHSRFLGFSGLAVAPAFQGRGCARILLEHAQQVARGQQLQGLRLFTNKQFASNVDLYLHHGFAVDREEPFMGGFTVYMRKPLAPDNGPPVALD
ncbi:N-acetyltransferase, partial [Acidovorax sp. Root219]|uniref:GNAT family N-acetyltransferase n=1 Tax=Acidovorax sp. Root219 TaxID=1736493 RepID=UPI0012F8B786